MNSDIGGHLLSLWAMMQAATTHRHDGPPDEPPPIGEAFNIAKRWFFALHISATVAIAVWVYSTYETTVIERAKIETQIAVLQARVEQLREDDAAQDAIKQRDLSNIAQRLDAQRGDIAALQAQVFSHINQDRQSFERLNRK